MAFDTVRERVVLLPTARPLLTRFKHPRLLLDNGELTIQTPPG